MSERGQTPVKEQEEWTLSWRVLTSGEENYWRGVVLRRFEETSLPKSPPPSTLLRPHLFPKVYAGLTVPFHPRPADGLPQYLLRRTGLPWVLPQTSPDCFSPGLGSHRVQAKWILEIGRSACQEPRTGFHLAGVTHRTLLHACAASAVLGLHFGSLEFFSSSPVSSTLPGQDLWFHRLYTIL